MSKYANKRTYQNKLADSFFAIEPQGFSMKVVSCTAWLKSNFANRPTCFSPKSKFLIILFVLLSFASCKKNSEVWNEAVPVSRQQSEKAQVLSEKAPSSQRLSGNTQAFQQAERLGEEELPPFVFKLSTSGYFYTVESNGRAKAISDKGRSKDFQLKYVGRSKDSYLELLFYAEYESDLVLLYQVSDGESVGGGITRMDQRGLRVKWTTSIESLNMGKGLIDDDRVYITGAGLIACLNLRTGKYLWKHEQLHEKYQSFTAFEVPLVEGDVVAFTARSDIGEPAKTIKVYKLSGEVKSVSDK